MNISDKKSVSVFAYIWAVIFLFLSYKIEAAESFFKILALSFVLTGFFYPQIFLKLKIFQSWVKFGEGLGRINGMIICFFLFFVIFTPIAIFFRLRKIDLLKKNFDKKLDSYFINRTQQPQDMRRQF